MLPELSHLDGYFVVKLPFVLRADHGRINVGLNVHYDPASFFDGSQIDYNVRCKSRRGAESLGLGPTDSPPKDVVIGPRKAHLLRQLLAEDRYQRSGRDGLRIGRGVHNAGYEVLV
jgi:hypothetical protein